MFLDLYYFFQNILTYSTLNYNSKNLLKWPWKMYCLNQCDESAFDVDQLESAGGKKRKVSREKEAGKNEGTWKTPNGPH